MTGGQLESRTATSDYKGLNTIFTFDPLTERWTRQPDMLDGRWYPTQVLLPDGRTAIMDGLDSKGVDDAPHNNDVEIFTPSPDRDGVGTVERVARRSGVGEPPGGGMYPHLFAMPSGRTLVAGPDSRDSWWMNSLGTGSSLSWTDTANPANHYFGSGVILPKDTPGSTEVALIGGDASKKVEVFDENRAQDGWKPQPGLNEVRGHLNTVLLPDGSMASVGGGYGLKDGRQDLFAQGNLEVELWDPATRAWRRGARQLEGRAYHSTALLLPDGRVMSAGDDTNGGDDRDTAEIYSPPYLFDADGSAAARPVIESAPQGVGYGSSVSVGFSGTDVAKAVLIAPGAVTHANDMSQRYVPLTVTGRTADSAVLTAPASANHAPPGQYMLFLINSRGVPSEAGFVQVDGRAPDEGTTTPDGGTTGPGDGAAAHRRPAAVGAPPRRVGAPPRRVGAPPRPALRRRLRAVRPRAVRSPRRHPEADRPSGTRCSSSRSSSDRASPRSAPAACACSPGAPARVRCAGGSGWTDRRLARSGSPAAPDRATC